MVISRKPITYRIADTGSTITGYLPTTNSFDGKTKPLKKRWMMQKQSKPVYTYRPKVSHIRDKRRRNRMYRKAIKRIKKASESFWVTVVDEYILLPVYEEHAPVDYKILFAYGGRGGGKSEAVKKAMEDAKSTR
jgi:hypothetical protein